MKLADIIILISVILILGLIIFFQFILPKITRKSPCSGCAYARKCTKKNDENSCNKLKK